MARGFHSVTAEREGEARKGDGEREGGRKRKKEREWHPCHAHRALAAHLKLAINWACTRYFIYFCLAVDRRVRGPRLPASPGRRGSLIKTPESH